MTHLRQLIETLKMGEGIVLRYENKEYILSVIAIFDGKNCYALEKDDQAMNVKKITDNYLYLYDYDLLDNRIEALLPLKECKFIEVIFPEV